MKLALMIVGLLILGSCKTKEMTAVDPSSQERPVIEKETEVAVEVDQQTGIMSLEERFTFTQEDDRSRHDQKQYFVIIGSFRKQENALGYKESLIAKGFDPVILLSENGLHRVSVDSYDMESNARDRIMKIRSQFNEHEDTWLLIRK